MQEILSISSNFELNIGVLETFFYNPLKDLFVGFDSFFCIDKMLCRPLTLITLIFALFLNCVCIAQYVLDSTGTCRYWMPFSHPSFKMSWTGECNNNTPNGSGTLIIGNNDYKALEYNGNILDGKFTGQGNLEQWQTKYIGNFTNGHFLNLTPDLLAKLDFNPIRKRT